MEKPIGKGGLGSVWLVRHRVLDTLFALKVLNPNIAEAKPEYEKRFLREAKLATKIRHPNLVAVHDAGFDFGKGIYYLVMDYVKGKTLRDVIAFEGGTAGKNRREGGPLRRRSSGGRPALSQCATDNMSECNGAYGGGLWYNVRMKKLVFLSVAVAVGFAQAAVYSVKAFGAKADGATDCTAAIQKAIDRAAAAGGGTAFIPGGGVYRTYTLHLKSNVELKVDRGATLKGGDDPLKYPLFPPTDVWQGLIPSLVLGTRTPRNPRNAPTGTSRKKDNINLANFLEVKV